MHDNDGSERNPDGRGVNLFREIYFSGLVYLLEDTFNKQGRDKLLPFKSSNTLLPRYISMVNLSLSLTLRVSRIFLCIYVCVCVCVACALVSGRRFFARSLTIPDAKVCATAASCWRAGDKNLVC